MSKATILYKNKNCIVRMANFYSHLQIAIKLS